MPGSFAGQASSDPNAKIVEAVSKIAYLPSENPQVATVSDISQLKGQSFFADAANGDKVLIYTNTKRAYLYRPSTGKIVNIGPVNTPQAQASSTPSASIDSQVARVDILNGTSVEGLTRVAALKIQKGDVQAQIVTRANAIKNTYTGTLVIDISGKNSTTAEKIATLLGGQTGKLPSPEVKPKDADILVILGSDFSK